MKIHLSLMTRNCLKAGASVMLFCFPLMGCNQNSDSSGGSDGTGSEVATTAISGNSNSSEGTTLSANRQPSWREKLQRNLTLVRSSWAVPSCNWGNLNSGCAGSSETISYNRCSTVLDPAISIQGSETLQWNNSSCCTTNPLSASSTTPCSFTLRTVNANGESSPLILSIGSNAVSRDTEEPSGFAEPKSGGSSVVCQGTENDSTCGAQREITILGAHYSGKVASAQWDHTVSTDSPLVVQGSASNRKILSGTIRVQHNLAKMVSVTQVTTPLTHSSGCCFPTGGSVTTTFSGGSLDGKTETLTYGPKCGQATLDNSEQKISGLTLHHCL